MRGVLAGKGSAIDAFVERMQCIPRILAARNAGFGRPLTEDELADLAQDCLGRVWRKLPEYAGRASLETWVWRFCTLELMNALRKKSRLPSPYTDLDDAPPERATSDPPPAEQPLLDLLHHLTPREAEVIRLRHVEALETMAEIGEALGISASSVKTHYYRGLEKLRALLRGVPPDTLEDLG